MQEHLLGPLACLLCDAPVNKWLTATNGGVGPKETFDIFQCTNCFSTRINPVPVSLGIYYLGYHSIPKGSNWKRAVKACKNRLAVVTRYVGDYASILDVGAGSGVFVAAASKTGHLTFAIEQDKSCRENIEAFMPGRVVEDLFSYEKEGFAVPDVITLWHVFEHIPNPNDFLAQVSRIFPITTKIIIEVPNAQSWMFKIMRSKWPHLDAPRHVFLPSKKGIECVAQKNGMRASRIQNHDNASWAAFSLSHFGNRVGELRLIQICRRILQILLAPFFFFENSYRSSTCTYLLVRDSK
jgi:hypothetical protein